MKKIHLLNIGYPKCGTTWLWSNLVRTNSIANFMIKENNCLITGTPVSQYCQQYDQYTEGVTANFSVTNITLDQYVIEQLSQHPQIVVSIILREPIQLLWSLYNFTKVQDIDFNGYCYRMYDGKWFAQPSVIVKRWRKFFGNRFNIFWYDDLKTDNLKFFHNYCNTMNLTPNDAKILKEVNITSYNNTLPEIDQDMYDLLQIESKQLLQYK